ncbi:MAG: transposase, partial [Candidatus Marinimicrobia bacterium]|nr:transposase [Candidatus Neomarinimicrobiota bacterium]
TLESIRDGLHKKGGTKWYDKVLSRIGRAQEKYKSISYFYDIEVERQGDKAVDLQWRMKPNMNMDERFGGTYYLRTSRMDLSEQEIWNLYLMLTDLEDSFRSLKSELGLRPNFHQMDHRIEAHLFITVLAYHFVTCIQWYLHRQGIYMRWSSIRSLLSTQVRVTTEMTTRDGRKIILRNTTEPERFHQMIARSLNIDPKPLGVVNIGL